MVWVLDIDGINNNAQQETQGVNQDVSLNRVCEFPARSKNARRVIPIPLVQYPMIVATGTSNNVVGQVLAERHGFIFHGCS